MFMLGSAMICRSISRFARDFAWTYMVLMMSARPRVAITMGRTCRVWQTTELSEVCFPSRERLGWTTTSMMSISKMNMNRRDSAAWSSTYTVSVHL